MAKHYTKLIIEINEDITSKVTAVKGDVNSRYLDVQLFNDSVPLDLTSHTVTMSAKSHPDSNFKVPINKFIDGVITDATNGRCQFELKTDILGQTGVLILQISIFSGQQEVLSTNPFNLYVIDGLRNDEQIEASNEFGALVVLFSEIQNALDDMNAIRENFGEPSQESIEQGILTFWGIIEQMRKDVSSAVAYDLPEKIGNPDDNVQMLTAFGKLNWIKNFLETSVAGVTIFDQPGTFDFKVPAGVTEIIVTACGGGGGGAGVNVGKGNNKDKAGGGGGGAAVLEKKLTVTLGQTIEITVGNGGAGGPAGNNGSAGEATVIGELLTLAGGSGGIANSVATSATGGASGGNGGGKGGDSGQDGADGIVGKGGVFDDPDIFEGHKRGGGGGGSLGDGANVPSDGNGKNGILGGGGSGASTPYTNRSYSGGKGGNGYVKINVGGVPE